MKKAGTIFLGIILTLLLLWQIPWTYSFLNPQKGNSQFVLYSPILREFTFSGGEGKKYTHSDSQGTIFKQNEIDSLHPVFYGRQLMSDGRFPDSIAGKPADYKQTQYDLFYFKHSPRDINTPTIGLYQLMESMSGRVKLVTPEDVFRIGKDGIEFIDAASNSVNYEKSMLFTVALQKKGFVFPAYTLSGNPSVKKDYDEGYLILDAERQLFHLKQVKGRPYVRPIEVPSGIRPECVFITEFRNRKTIGFMTDDQHRFYAISTKDYQFTQIQIPAFDPRKNALMIYGMVYEWTVKVSSKEKIAFYALDGEDHTLIKSYEVPQTSSWSEKVGNTLDLIGLRFTDPLDKFIYPRFGK